MKSSCENSEKQSQLQEKVAITRKIVNVRYEITLRETSCNWGNSHNCKNISNYKKVTIARETVIIKVAIMRKYANVRYEITLQETKLQ